MPGNVEMTWVNNWGANDDRAYGNNIYRSAGSVEPPDWSVIPLLTSVGASDTTYTDPNIPDGDYWYLVQAYNNNGFLPDNTGNTEPVTVSSTRILVMGAQATTAGSTGYDGTNGTLNPDNINGDTVIRIETHPALGGIFAIQLTGPTTFESIQSIGTGPFVLDTTNSFYNQASSTWFWVGVPFQFNAGTDYIIMVQT
jgi:hypothetical protein